MVKALSNSSSKVSVMVTLPSLPGEGHSLGPVVIVLTAKNVFLTPR